LIVGKTVPEKAKWHHIVVTFYGVLENAYVDGTLNTQQPIILFVERCDILIGASGEPSENDTGYIARAQLFEKVLTPDEVVRLMNETKPKKLVKQ